MGLGSFLSSFFLSLLYQRPKEVILKQVSCHSQSPKSKPPNLPNPYEQKPQSWENWGCSRHQAPGLGLGSCCNSLALTLLGSHTAQPTLSCRMAVRPPFCPPRIKDCGEILTMLLWPPEAP